MFDATVIYSKVLSEQECGRVQELTSACTMQPIGDVHEDIYEFCRIVLGQDIRKLIAFQLGGVSSLTQLNEADLRPDVFFRTEGQLVESLKSYGRAASWAEHIIRVLDVARGCAAGILDEQMNLNLPLNRQIVDFLANDMRPVFRNELACIIQSGLEYYTEVSHVET